MIAPFPQERLAEKRRARMEAVDAMKPDLRACVHDYGLTVVRDFLDLGITKPKHIRHVVETVLDEFSPTRGTRSKQGPRPGINP